MFKRVSRVSPSFWLGTPPPAFRSLPGIGNQRDLALICHTAARAEPVVSNVCLKLGTLRSVWTDSPLQSADVSSKPMAADRGNDIQLEVGYVSNRTAVRAPVKIGFTNFVQGFSIC
jgi:hypothetical protein